MSLRRICDKCKQEILSHTNYNLVSIAAYRITTHLSKEAQQLLSTKQLELCDRCFDSLASLYDAIYYADVTEGNEHDPSNRS